MKRLVRYISKFPLHGILLSSNKETYSIIGRTDSDWAGWGKRILGGPAVRVEIRPRRQTLFHHTLFHRIESKLGSPPNAISPYLPSSLNPSPTPQPTLSSKSKRLDTMPTVASSVSSAKSWTGLRIDPKPRALAQSATDNQAYV